MSLCDLGILDNLFEFILKSYSKIQTRNHSDPHQLSCLKTEILESFLQWMHHPTAIYST